MRRLLLDELPARAASFDVETWRIRPGLMYPPLVLAAAAHVSGGQLATEVMGKREARELFALLLDDPRRVIVGANLPYDLLVMAVELAREGVDAMPEIYRALMDDGRVFDIQIAEMLDAIAEGCLGNDPRTGGPLVGPDTGRRAGYSLAMVTDLVLGRTDAKALGHVATQYEQYDGVPIDQLPVEFRDYPQDDVRNALEDALAQAGHVPRGSVHKWGAKTECEWCGLHPKSVYTLEGKYLPCRALRRSRNLHDLANQVGTAWAMHLGAAEGFRVNQASVDKIEVDALDGRAEAEEPFVAAGLLKRNRDGSTSRDMAAIAAAVALAYGADPARPCATCRGTRKVVSSKAKPVKCPLCKGAGSFAATACPKCSGTGAIPDPRQLVNCTACASTGFDLGAAPNVPKTETGRIGTGRDVLNESGDEVLMGLADHQEGAKTLDVYVPYLRRARVPTGGHAEGCPTRSDGDCTCQGPYEDIPLTLWPNVLLETGRTSYRGVIQLFPRKPRHKVTKEGSRKGEWVPSLRECIEARPPIYDTVEVPDDYVLQPGERRVD